MRELRRGRKEAREGRRRRRAALDTQRLQDDDVEPGRVRVALERSRGADVGEEREERLDGSRAPFFLRVLWNAVTSVNRLG